MAANSLNGRETSPSLDRDGHPRIVLIVDDHPDSCTVYSVILRHAGYATLCSHDGGEALDVVASGLPDLVTMDVSMPGMDGISATRAIRARTDWRRVHIVATTAHHLEPDEWRAAGFDGYLQKPVLPRQLVAYVANALRNG